MTSTAADAAALRAKANRLYAQADRLMDAGNGPAGIRKIQEGRKLDAEATRIEEHLSR